MKKGKLHLWNGSAWTVCGRELTDAVRWTSIARRVTCERCARRTPRAIVARIRRAAS